MDTLKAMLGKCRYGNVMNPKSAVIEIARIVRALPVSMPRRTPQDFHPEVAYALYYAMPDRSGHSQVTQSFVLAQLASPGNSSKLITRPKPEEYRTESRADSYLIPDAGYLTIC